MSREIKSTEDTGYQNSNDETNTYKDRLVKLIPSEIVAAYVTLFGLISGVVSENKITLLWIVIGVLFILTPFYLIKISGVKKMGQIIFSTFGFLIWVFATGSPIQNIWDFQVVFLASIILIIYTLIIPLIYKG